MSLSYPFEGNLHFDRERLKMKSLNLQTDYLMIVYKVQGGSALWSETQLKRKESFSGEPLILAYRQMVSHITAHL